MKLRNKKTGNIVDFCYLQNDYIAPLVLTFKMNDKPVMRTYNSLAELNEEWEDYQEPKEYWYIEPNGVIARIDEWDCCTASDIEIMKTLGNYFETKEEAEQAVEKLKAFKRLKDLGFKFDGIRWVDTELHIKTNISTPHPFTKEEADEFNECLHKVFGGKD